MLRLYSHFFPKNAVLQVLLDVAALFCVVLSSVVLMSDGVSSWTFVAAGGLWFAGSLVFLSILIGLYGVHPDRSVKEIFIRVGLLAFACVPCAYFLYHSEEWSHVQRPHHFLGSVIVVLSCVVLFWRGMHNRRCATALRNRRILILGTGDDAAAVAGVLAQAENSDLVLIGFYPAVEDKKISIDERRILSDEQSLLEVAQAKKIDEIIVAVRERRGGVLPLSQLLDCKLSGIEILDLSSFFERLSGQLRVDSLRANWLIYGEGFQQNFLRMLVKRIFDIACALGLLVLTLPVMLIAIIAVVIEDGWPVLYRQERVGQHGKTFKVIKFRSMRNDAEKDGTPRWASANDNRVTRVGRFMRKTRIDELPQLFNVLFGQMSMVGPRPERPYFVDQLATQIPFYTARHSVKPGVTGWAQVRYQYGATVDDAVQKLQYDLYYVKNHSLFLDLMVLRTTVRVVLMGSGQ